VAARLAALKAKLQADKARAGRPDSTPPSAQASPTGALVPKPSPFAASAAAQPQAAADVAVLQQQLDAARQQLESEQRAHQQAADTLRVVQTQQERRHAEL
jgi:hypothetical protein